MTRTTTTTTTTAAARVRESQWRVHIPNHKVNITSASSIDRRSRIDPPSRAMRDARAFFARRVDSGSIGAARDAR
jgi:hypothetical protein